VGVDTTLRTNLTFLKNITGILSDKSHSGIDQDILIWREKICDAIFYFFSFFGLFAVVPSTILSIREGYYQIAVIGPSIYIFCVCFAFSKKISYLVKAISGCVLFFVVGLVVLYQLGPRGVGAIWIFSTTILAALLLGNVGGLISFALNGLAHVIFYFLLGSEIVQWSGDAGLTQSVWGVMAVNFILLNFVLLVAYAIFFQGFKALIGRSRETRDASIIGLAKLAEYRDSDTGSHLKRIQQYTVLLARELSHTAEYHKYITDGYMKDLYISSILHDIGKVGIPDSILLKPGPLTEQEFGIIKQHSNIGGGVIVELEAQVNGRSFYTVGKEIALYHHERWDGSGYPEGLRGNSIPLSARITALADVYDAMTSKRSYKDAATHEEAAAVIAEGRGSQFDPDIVDAFMRIAARFSGISDILADGELEEIPQE
jgi:HD-GYP domain-containing protein (c-di-GMP phosphodiesterase class II)